jgi:hypothetical protein
MAITPTTTPAAMAALFGPPPSSGVLVAVGRSVSVGAAVGPMVEDVLEVVSSSLPPYTGTLAERPVRKTEYASRPPPRSKIDG